MTGPTTTQTTAGRAGQDTLTNVEVGGFICPACGEKVEHQTRHVHSRAEWGLAPGDEGISQLALRVAHLEQRLAESEFCRAGQHADRDPGG